MFTIVDKDNAYLLGMAILLIIFVASVRSSIAE